MIVLDASAVVDLVARRPAAEWVIDALEGELVATVGHQMAEVVSALARLERANALSVPPMEALADVAAMPQEVHDIDADLVTYAWTLGERIRVLDGLYVALAARLDADLVTTDRRLVRADPPCRVIAPATA